MKAEPYTNICVYIFYERRSQEASVREKQREIEKEEKPTHGYIS